MIIWDYMLVMFLSYNIPTIKNIPIKNAKTKTPIISPRMNSPSAPSIGIDAGAGKRGGKLWTGTSLGRGWWWLS